VVLVDLLLESVELLLKSTDTACCGHVWNQCHLVLDALELVSDALCGFTTVAMFG
jgi:hypothetical protein